MGAGDTKIAGEARGPRYLLPLTPAVLDILLALADRERHGYGIMREVEGRSGGEVRLGPGTLYGSIKRMLGDGLIEESDERPDPEMDDQHRRYYRITDFGRRVAGAEAERLASLVDTAREKKLLRSPRQRPYSAGAWCLTRGRARCRKSPSAFIERCSWLTRRSFGGLTGCIWRGYSRTCVEKSSGEVESSGLPGCGFAPC